MWNVLKLLDKCSLATWCESIASKNWSRISFFDRLADEFTSNTWDKVNEWGGWELATTEAAPTHFKPIILRERIHQRRLTYSRGTQYHIRLCHSTFFCFTDDLLRFVIVAVLISRVITLVAIATWRGVITETIKGATLPRPERSFEARSSARDGHGNRHRGG